MRRVLWAHDGRISWTSLLNHVSERFESDPHAIVRWMGSAKPRDFDSCFELVWILPNLRTIPPNREWIKWQFPWRN
jgi:hypothetical protein